MVKLYTPASHRFFDVLVTFVAGFSLQNLGGGLQRSGRIAAFVPSDHILIQGKANVTDLQMVLRPHSILDPILTNGWPLQLEIDEQPLDKAIPPRFAKLAGMNRLNAIQISHTFVSYFESNVSLVRDKHGSDPYRWPEPWNFARVVRNALAHGGTINIENPSAPPITWKSITYSPANNGTEILFQDMTFVEIVILMGEMDRVA